MVNNEAEISGGGDGTAVLVLVVCQWYVDDDVGFMVWSLAKRWKNSAVTHHLLTTLNLLQMDITSLRMSHVSMNDVALSRCLS